MSLSIIDASGFAHAVNPIVNRNQAGKMAGAAGRIAALETAGRILLAGWLMLLAGIPLPGRASTYIDDFATGPQSFLLEPGDTSTNASLSDLDTNQVVWGYRDIWVAVDQQFCGYRPLELGSISVAVSGSAPGSFSVQWDVALPEGETPYDPGLSLSYKSTSSPADWSAFDRIVFTFTTPPTIDMSIDTTAGYDIYTSWVATTPVAAGAHSATILFSDLTGSTGAFTGGNIMFCWFSFNFPISESFVIGNIQVTGTATPPRPCLNAEMGTGGLTLTWPTNAAGFALHSTTNLAQSFSPVACQPVVAGTNYSVTRPCVCPSEFFCLKLTP
jgi:hypothetical protein